MVTKNHSVLRESGGFFFLTLNMKISDFIYRYFDIKEGYQLPEKLLKVLLNESEKEKFLDGIAGLNLDYSVDIFRDFFQDEHGDRDKLKQDYTPDSVSQIVARKIKNGDKVLDVCAGTGSLSISAISRAPDIFLRCEEFSERAIPFLLANLSLRNVNAEVIRKDVLTNETFEVYRLRKGQKFSRLEKVKTIDNILFDVVISNPPYSLKWNPKEDERFENYPLPPKQFSDFCFVIHGIFSLNETGKASFILPHGVLFRSNQEQKVRESLIRNNLISGLIGLPDKLFLNTAIPVAILELEKSHPRKGVFVVNAHDEFTKRPAQNILEQVHIDKILAVCEEEKEVKDFSRFVAYEELETNDFNLNIPRYVMKFEEEVIDFASTVKEIVKIEKEIVSTEKEFIRQLSELTGFSLNELEQIQEWKKLFGQTSKKLPRLKELLKAKDTQLELF